VLPPGEFNGIMLELLTICSGSLITTDVNISTPRCHDNTNKVDETKTSTLDYYSAWHLCDISRLCSISSNAINTVYTTWCFYTVIETKTSQATLDYYSARHLCDISRLCSISSNATNTVYTTWCFYTVLCVNVTVIPASDTPSYSSATQQ